MAGNVYEWCWDRYDPAYPAGPVTDPLGAQSGTQRVLRGGAWFNAWNHLGASYRNMYDPGMGGNNCGLRVVRATSF